MAKRELNKIEKQLISLYKKNNLGLCEICTKCKANKSFYKAVGCWFVGDFFDGDESRRILFVGKNARGNPGSEYPENQNKDGFLEEFNYSRECLWCKSWAYWSYTREICERLFPKKGMESVAFTNMVKCNDSPTKDTTDQFTKDCCIKELGIIRKEIEIINPTHIVFYTSYYYDEWISSLFDNSFYMGSSRITIGKKRMPYAEFECTIGNKQMHALRVGHPERMKREEFITRIVDWVNGTV